MQINAYCPSFVKKDVLVGTKAIALSNRQLLGNTLETARNLENASVRKVPSTAFFSTKDFFQTTNSALLTLLANVAKPDSGANLVRRESVVIQDSSGTNVTSFWKTETFLELANVLLSQSKEQLLNDQFKASAAQNVFNKSVEVYTSVYVVTNECKNRGH